MARDIIKEARLFAAKKRKPYRQHFYPLQLKGRDLIRLADFVLMAEAASDFKKDDYKLQRAVLDQIAALGFKTSYEYYLDSQDAKWRRQR